MIFARLLAPALLFVVVSACGDSSTTGDDCVGGVVVDGKCEGKCDDSLCLEGNVCVGNRCMLECDTHTACFSPLAGDSVLQECAELKRDTKNGVNDGDDVFVCAASAKNEDFGRLCPFIAECETSPWVCPNGTPCEEGEDSEGCSAAECRPLTCHTTGEGDAEAYCTSFDCTEDAHCGPGMYCGVVNLPEEICGTNKPGEYCSSLGGFLGSMCQLDAGDCVDPSDFDKDGATFQEGPIALMRNTCLKREPCAPCSNAVDCSLRGDMTCVTIGEQNSCVATCTETDDCPDDAYCYEGFCIPNTGSCVPPATDNFCFNCLNDLQCGGAPNNEIACVAAGNAGIKACADLGAQCADGCSESPSGLDTTCLENPNICFFPFLAGPSSFQCWKEN